MLFEKKIDPSCSYCQKGSRISDTEVICIKKGIVSSAGHCRAFSYDPTKREPAHPVLLNTAKYSPKDFEL